MKTFPIKKKDGRLISFEIDNSDIWPQKIIKILSALKGVTNIQKKKLFQRLDETYSDTIHFKFRYKNTEFIVWEPYGDNSRYWIGPKDDKSQDIDITEIESAFQQINQAVTPRVVMWIILGAVLCELFWKVV